MHLRSAGQLAGPFSSGRSSRFGRQQNHLGVVAYLCTLDQLDGKKVWRKLYQEVLHLHKFADRWGELATTVSDWLDQFADGSPELLRYVGLCPN